MELEPEGPSIASHYKFKINILGEPEVGKSAFNKYCSTRFESSLEELHEQVYGVSFAVKILKNIDIEMTLVVWNFTGQERYKTVQPSYMKGVSGILLLFDLTRLETFLKLPEWLEFIKRNETNVPILLVGTKADLFHLKDVTDTGIENFVRANGLEGYYEVSFKTGLNVEAVINKMSEIIYQIRVKKQKYLKMFKLNRKHPKLPLILDEDRVRSEFILTIKTIFSMISDDFLGRIRELDAHLKDIQKSGDTTKIRWLKEELEKLSKELITQNRMVETLFLDTPVSIPTYLRLDLSKEWKKQLDQLRYRLFVFKDVCNRIVRDH
ncbi:MAG: GTP-binding protein [Candidatus Helarchaeota archaeon]|nr:GTP-binding protein [Candidatus Helarchaeota archaeon]